MQQEICDLKRFFEVEKYLQSNQWRTLKERAGRNQWLV